MRLLFNYINQKHIKSFLKEDSFLYKNRIEIERSHIDNWFLLLSKIDIKDIDEIKTALSNNIFYFKNTNDDTPYFQLKIKKYIEEKLDNKKSFEYILTLKEFLDKTQYKSIENSFSTIFLTIFEEMYQFQISKNEKELIKKSISKVKKLENIRKKRI